MTNHHTKFIVGGPYPFSEDSSLKKMLLDIIKYTRDEFYQRDTTKTVFSSPTIYYKMSNGEIPVDGGLINDCGEKKLRILITLSLTLLGAEWSTKHKKRNCIVDKTVMEENIVKIFGEEIPWKPTQKTTEKPTP